MLVEMTVSILSKTTCHGYQVSHCMNSTTPNTIQTNLCKCIQCMNDKNWSKKLCVMDTKIVYIQMSAYSKLLQLNKLLPKVHQKSCLKTQKRYNQTKILQKKLPSNIFLLRGKYKCWKHHIMCLHIFCKYEHKEIL